VTRDADSCRIIHADSQTNITTYSTLTMHTAFLLT